jgi:hypothetical protein
LLPNDLIVIRNQGVDHGEHARHQEGGGEQGNMHNMVEVQANSKSRSLTLSPPYLQIDVQDVSDL